jgi:predicted  nucleic acid-binding Zn-ribbon protein
MAKISATLREAHRLRRHIRELQAEIDRGPRVRKAQQAKLDTAEAAWKDYQETLKRLKITAHEKDVSLKSTDQLIKKYEGQLSGASNQKEYAAAEHEIAAARERVARLEEEIFAALSDVDERTANLPAQEELVKQARAEFAVWEQKAKERFEMLTAELKKAEAELQVTEKEVPADAAAMYQRLVKAYGADAFAAVKNKVCQHCQTGITGIAQSNLEAGQFVTCSSCNRGLYLAE